MSATELPDVEFAAKKWAANHPYLASLGGRVFFAFPEGSPTLPLITVSIISGSFDPGPAIAATRLTWSAWGSTKKAASDAKRALVAAMRSADNVALDPTTHCFGVEDIFETWLPDDEAKLARYVVDATFRTASLTAA